MHDLKTPLTLVALFLLFTLSAVSALAQPTPDARPKGGTVVAGKASISFGPGVVHIKSSTPQTVINWESFDIGARQQVVITGPKNANVLNR
ncbi:MAG: hypothetical protein FWD12_06480, partial [Alphaproteobacteria bacterium]|nr:hypothetical protein [Alphaproteobacteria bacterium]